MLEEACRMNMGSIEMKEVRENPLVTIVTPCYNGERFLDTYFQSILSQTYDHIELIFVDDGSTDDTRRIAEEYGEKLQERGISFLYCRQENRGQAAAINMGLQYAAGKYLIWPDSDDWLEPDSIEKRVEFLENNKEYRFVRSNASFFDFETKEPAYRASQLENRFNSDIFLDLILETTFCFCGCYMIYLEDLRAIYPDLRIEESSAGQNWQILIPIAGKYPCGYIDEDLYHIAIRKDSHSRTRRTLDEKVSRRMELKRILGNAVRISGRKDRDYQYIIDTKYERILFFEYIGEKAYQPAEQIYRKLRKKGELNEAICESYYTVIHPRMSFLYPSVRLIRRGVNKLKRMTASRTNR